MGLHALDPTPPPHAHPHYTKLESVVECEAWEPGDGVGRARKQSCQKSWSEVPDADVSARGDHAPLKAYLSAPAPRSYSISRYSVLTN